MHWVALQPLPEPDQRPHSGPLATELSDALAALGWWALQFTPKVTRIEEALALEVSASERLWGGRERLLRHIIESNKPVASVKYAQGATSLIAIARLQMTGFETWPNPSTRPEGNPLPLQRPVTAPDALPLSALAAARPHLATLERMGCTCWGQLRALPRGGVARRFGASVLEALDQAYGHRPELYPWLVLPEVFEATLELSAQVESAPALLFGARRLLNQLRAWLQMRQAGVLAFELGWTMDARRDTATQGALVVRTAQPTLDTAHLQRLLGEHLARLTLPAPVQYLHLRTLDTQGMDGESASLLPDEQRPGDSLHQLLERLSARLGSQHVLQMQARADHRPEQMQQWKPASSAAQLIAACASRTGARDEKNQKENGFYPTWLLASPLKLVVRQQRPLYQGPLTLLAGPQRLEAAWWGDCALRDYFVARSQQAGLLWIYCERPGRTQQGPDRVPDWYLHGIFA